MYIKKLVFNNQYEFVFILFCYKKLSRVAHIVITKTTGVLSMVIVSQKAKIILLFQFVWVNMSWSKIKPKITFKTLMICNHPRVGEKLVVKSCLNLFNLYHNFMCPWLSGYGKNKQVCFCKLSRRRKHGISEFTWIATCSI